MQIIISLHVLIPKGTTRKIAELKKLAIDPVCGMTVNEARAENESVYRGIKYYFCSAVCREEFDRDPDAYMYADADELESGYNDDQFDAED